MYLNTIQIIGFVGKDPERRQVQGKDAAYTVFSVATQRSWKNAQGEWQTRTEWHRIVAWNRIGELATARLRSGKLWLMPTSGGEEMLVPIEPGLFQVGKEETAERLRLDVVVRGKALRANLSGVDFYRNSTP